jgi:hypothetical protein
MNLAMNKKNYIIIIIFLLLSSVLVLFFILPYFKEIGTRSAELVAEKDQISFFGLQSAEISNFKKGYADYLANIKNIEQMFVDPQDPISFIEFMEKTALDSRITLKVSPQLSSDKNSKVIIFQLSGGGNFPDLLNFLERLERGPYLIDIGNLNISNSKENIGTKEKTVPQDLLNNVQADLLIEVLAK